MSLLQPGGVVAVDALTYPGLRLVAQTLHLELAPLPAAGAGTDLDAFEKLCRQRNVRAIYSMPTINNPLGWVMDLPHRRALERERVPVSTAQPFATSAHVPHAIRLALGSVAPGALRQALAKVRQAIENHTDC